jgi:uncharacterized membrane protein
MTPPSTAPNNASPPELDSGNSNHISDQFTDDREPRSPVWRPVYAGGTSVQFANRPADLERPDRTWRPLGCCTCTIPRTRWGTPPSRPSGTARNGPTGPRATTSPPGAGWYPIVTDIQEVADLIAGFSATSGYGHNYGIDFVTGWAAVAPPDGWTTTDSVRLERHLPSD